MRSILVVKSYHHHNTEKVANAMAPVLQAKIIGPSKADIGELDEYELIGFGSGIYDGKHHLDILDLAGRLPTVDAKKAFIFSTSFDTRMDMVHRPLRDILSSKGYKIVGEFNCKGHNTNSFLRFFGGLDKGRPNADDLRRAEDFARRMIKSPV